jgi:hypothetical protein
LNQAPCALVIPDVLVINVLCIALALTAVGGPHSGLANVDRTQLAVTASGSATHTCEALRIVLADRVHGCPKVRG